MIKTKQSLIAFIVMLSFLVTSVMPIPSAFASQDIAVAFSARTIDDGVLEITATGDDAEAFMETVHEVRVVGSVYQLPTTNSRLIFTYESNKITIEESPAIFKSNLIELVSSSYGTKSFTYNKEDGVSVAEGLEISGIVFGEEGKSEVVNGEELGAFAKYVGFQLDYDYNNSNGSALFSLSKQITKVNFDGVNYPRLDERGDANFILWKGSLNAYDQYPVGKKIYADYVKNGGESGKHRVEIFFSDNSSVVYEDSGYTAPSSDSDTESGDSEESLDPPNGDQDAPESEVIEEPSEGSLAKTYPIEGVSFVKEDSEVRIDFPNAFSKTIANAIEKLSINGVEFSADKFRFSYIHDFLSNDEEVYKQAIKNETIDLKIYFNDKSVARFHKSVELPSPDISLNYEIGDVSLSASELRITVNAKSQPHNLVRHLSSGNLTLDTFYRVRINETNFWLSEFSLENNVLVSTSKSVLDAAKEGNPISIELIFSDKSKLSVSKRVDEANVEEPEEEQNHGLNPTEVSVSETRLTMQFEEGHGLSQKHLITLKEVTVNGEDYPYTQDKFSLDGANLISTDDVIVRKAKTKSPIKVILTFNDDSQVFFNKDATQTDNDLPSISEEDVRQITSVLVTKPIYGSPELVIAFDNPVELSKGLAFRNSIDKVTINGEDFLGTLFYINYNGELKSSDEAAIAKANEKSPIATKITFKDGRVISKDLDTIEEKPIDEGLTLNSNLANGDYTLTYRAYQKGTLEGSVLEEFFDKKAKLHVEDGIKTVTFLNHAFSDLILDFTIADNGENKRLEKRITRYNKKGGAASSEFSTSLSKLTGKLDAYILGTGPMSGKPSDLGNYDSESYKKLDIVFDNVVTEGFTDFIKNEEYNKKREKNDEILINALIEQGFDTNNDEQISSEELRAGKGMPAKLIEDTKVPNVLNLEGLGLVDISLLKDLGPGVQHINLDANDIESLPEGLFDNATGLKRIFLGGNNIAEIPAGLFKNLTNLTYLDLEGNPIETLPKDIFKNNTKLQNLSLSGARLKSLPSDLIQSASKLKEFYLRENPELTNLSDDFFSGQKGRFLYRVELGYTGLTKLPKSIGHLKGLRQLGVESANLSELPDLSQLTSAERVDFEGNAIKVFPIDLYKNMVKRAKNHAYSNYIKLDLSMNDIKELPLEEMRANADGAKRMALQIDRNYLKTPLSSAEEKEYENFGINFKNGNSDTYYPQKGESKIVGQASEGTITLNSDFDILELYYWHIGDVYGKSKFKTPRDFLTYLQGEGRVINNVSKTLSREEAIKQIFEAKHMDWKVQTTIVKNGTTEVYDETVQGQKEGLSQTFTDNTMKKGDTYHLVKKLYRKSISGWAFEMSLEADFEATGASNIHNSKVSVALYETNTTNLSMANRTLKPQADLEERDGKFYYTIYLKPMEVKSLTGEVVNFYYTKDGVKTLVPSENVGGEYPKAYTMEFDRAQTRVPVSFVTNLDFLGERSADLVFGENATPSLPSEKTVKGYVVTTNEDRMSMADAAIVRDVVYTEDETNYNFSVGFKPMTLQGETAKVATLSVKQGASFMPAQKDSQKEGFFAFSLPKEMVNRASDTKLPIAFTLTPAVSGHQNALEAKLVLDWNNDFTPIKDNTAPSTGENTFKAYLLTKDKQAISMADQAFERQASYVDKDGWRTVSLRFNPISIQGERAKVKRIQYEAMGSMRVMTRDRENEGVFSFRMPVFATSMEAGRELRVFFELEPNVTGHDKPLEALLVLDWDNSFTLPNKPINPDNSGSSSAGSEVVSHLGTWVKNPANGERSMADRSIMRTAKVTEENGRYTYEVGFKPVTIPFGGKDITGNIIELSALVDGREEVLRESGKNGEYILYTITLDKKVNELPIRFDVDYMKELGGGKRDAIIVFDWNGNTSAPSGGGAAPIVAVPNKVVALNETPVLKDFKGSYMKGYPDGSFKPNNKITRAETAMVYSQFLDLAKVKNNSKLIYVKKGAWYEDAMEKLYTLGAWKVQEEKTRLVVKPDEMVTRAELAQVLASIKGLKATNKDKTFSDLDKNHWANEAIMACAEAGILSGYGDGTIKPDNQITRAEFATMINRAFDLKGNGKALKFTDLKESHWAYQAIQTASH